MSNDPHADRKMRIPLLVWSWPGAFVVLLAALLPIYGPLMPVIEGKMLPVTSRVEFVDIKSVEGGLSVRLHFTKLRDCEYLGVTMDAETVPVDFLPISGGAPITLPTGERLSRPWFVGVTDIDALHGLRLRWVHRCNPFWTTVTIGYP